MRHFIAVSASVVASALAVAGPSRAGQDAAALDTLPRKDRIAYFAEAVAAGRTGTARKTMPVDARPAGPGEVVVSIIAGEGVETRSKPASEGDWVVRNRCPETGNEEILVSAEKFPTRYGEALSEPDAQGYREFQPKGSEMIYTVALPQDGEFAIEAPWGELQRVRPGDAVVQTPQDPQDTYRIQGQAFACTYEILKAAKAP
jgi:hypothetical protein